MTDRSVDLALEVFLRQAAEPMIGHGGPYDCISSEFMARGTWSVPPLIFAVKCCCGQNCCTRCFL